MNRVHEAWVVAGLIWAFGVAATAGEPAASTAYQEAIAPLLQVRCLRCHGEEKVKGKLRLDTPAGILAGGSGGPCLEPGNAEMSEMYIRVTLPHHDEDHMPSQGEPLTPGQTEVIRWWIDAGASFEQTLAESDAPHAILEAITAMNFADPAATDLPAPTPEPVHRSAREMAEQRTALAVLNERGAVAVPLFSGSPLVTVNFSVSDREITDQDLAFLAPLSADIVSLNLAGTHITDNGLRRLAGLSVLARLHLEHTSITDVGLVHLAAMPSLEILNLVGTTITDSGLSHLRHLPDLEAVYLWRTRVTDQGVNQFRLAHEKTHIILGWHE